MRMFVPLKEVLSISPIIFNPPPFYAEHGSGVIFREMLYRDKHQRDQVGKSRDHFETSLTEES